LGETVLSFHWVKGVIEESVCIGEIQVTVLGIEKQSSGP